MKLRTVRKLDQTLIDKLVLEAERGYDLSLAQRLILREGRPAQGEPRGESPRVASRLPEHVYRAAKKRATGEGLTVSQVIRALLTGYAAGQPSPPKANRTTGGIASIRRARHQDARN